MYNSHSQKDRKLVFKTNYRFMQVKSIAECSKGEHSAILLTFIKLPFVIEILVLSILSGRFTQVLLYMSGYCTSWKQQRFKSIARLNSLISLSFFV